LVFAALFGDLARFSLFFAPFARHLGVDGEGVGDARGGVGLGYVYESVRLRFLGGVGGAYYHGVVRAS